MTQEATTKRRPRIDRTAGERRLIEATIRLYRDQPFEGASVREIARLADVNHGYVHVWFGGKGGLLVAAIEQLAAEFTVAARTSALDEHLVSDSAVVTLLRLIAALQAGYPDLRPFGGTRPPLMALADAQRLIRSVDDATAVTLAEMMVALATGALLVGRTLQFDYGAMIVMWRRLLDAVFPPAASGSH